MADDKKSPDEYEYPSEEYYKGGEYTPPETDESLETESVSRPSFFSRKLFSILGILIAVGVVYLVLMYNNARKAKELGQPTPTMDTGSASLPSAASAPSQVITAPATAPESPVPSPPLDGTVDRLSQLNQANQQAMANLQNQVQQLQSQLSEVTTSVSALTNQLQVIANEVRAIAIGRSLQGRDLSLTTRGTAYTLKALVPGRAWLQSKQGTTTTVTIGDRLAGYGIIQMINTDQGIVTTSSGAIIQYGLKDS